MHNCLGCTYACSLANVARCMPITDTQDLEVLEDFIIAKSFEEYDMLRLEQEEAQ